MTPVHGLVSSKGNAWVLVEPVFRYPDQLWQALVAAYGGDPLAQFQVGFMYFSGRGKHLRIPQDFAVALSWLGRAAERDQPKALYYLGSAYQWGLGVAKDLGVAKTYFRRAAELEHAWGQAAYAGLCFADDINEAQEWTRRAANNGHVPSIVDLAVNKHFEMASGERDVWLRKAMEAGSIHAKLVLAGRRPKGS